ncbi:alpha/beta hydrolase [Subtercola boreus]|nr:alpha/beta hydrolase [Subtercola boreus]
MTNSPLDLGGELIEQRTILHQMLTSHPLPDDVSSAPIMLGGVPALSIDITGQASHGTILFFHGGVFAMGSAEASVGLACDLGRRAHMRVITVDYRLAPEHPYPAATDDAFAAYQALVATGDAGQITIAGESAGGNLAVITLLAIRDAGLPVPSACVVLSPWTDLAVTGDSSITKAAADPALTPSALRIRARDYLGELDPSSGAVSPIYADLTGLPPLLIQVGSNEILLDDAVRLAAIAAAADVRVILDITPEVPHVFQAFSALLDEGDDALDRAAAFLRSNTTTLV